jgi:hypothetical protein
MALTASVNDQVPRLATDGDGSDVGDILVGHGARAHEAVARGLVAVDLLDLRAAFGDEVLDRAEVGNMFHGQSGGLGTRLNRRGRDNRCRCCHNGEVSVEKHGAGGG